MILRLWQKGVGGVSEREARGKRQVMQGLEGHFKKVKFYYNYIILKLFSLGLPWWHSG